MMNRINSYSILYFFGLVQYQLILRLKNDVTKIILFINESRFMLIIHIEIKINQYIEYQEIFNNHCK